MESFIYQATKLYVAVDAEGKIVNNNDSRELGPAFALDDTKVRMEYGEVVANYALHIDYNFNKQGAFSILNCSRVTAIMLAKLYCKKHNIIPVSRSWLQCDNYENCYQVIDNTNAEYNFHISRAYYKDGKPRDFFGAYVSIRKGEKIKFIEITNINDL